VFSTACDSASITSQNGSLSICLESGKQRKIGFVGDDSHTVFGKKFLGEKKCAELIV
jgi:hypothetical protein